MNAFGLNDRERDMICTVLAKHGEVKEAKIFGSRAKGNHQPNSDVDIAVWGTTSFGALASVYGELEELPLPYKFDVVGYEAVRNRELRDHIDRVGQRLYVRNDKVATNLRD